MEYRKGNVERMRMLRFIERMCSFVLCTVIAGPDGTFIAMEKQPCFMKIIRFYFFEVFAHYFERAYRTVTEKRRRYCKLFFLQNHSFSRSFPNTYIVSIYIFPKILTRIDCRHYPDINEQD